MMTNRSSSLLILADLDPRTCPRQRWFQSQTLDYRLPSRLGGFFRQEGRIHQEGHRRCQQSASISK